MKTLKTLIVFAALVTTTPAFAHAPKLGANGGQQADAGSLHVEVVSKGAALTVFLRDHSDKVVPSADYKGTAIFIVNGKPQRIPLTPAGDNKLSGTASTDLPSEPKGAVQITIPGGGTVQAKFN
jgi:hypothetical protein